MRVVLCQMKKGLPSALALSMDALVLATRTLSKVSISYLAVRPFCQFCMSVILGKGANGPSSTTFCLPTAPHLGSTVGSSVVVAVQCTMSRGPVLSIQSCG